MGLQRVEHNFLGMYTLRVNESFPGGSMVKKICLPVQETQEKWVRSLGQEGPLEKERTSHSSILG